MMINALHKLRICIPAEPASICVFRRPFSETSFNTDVIDIIKKSEKQTKYKTYAVLLFISKPVQLCQVGSGYYGIKSWLPSRDRSAPWARDLVAYKRLKLTGKGIF